MGDSKIEWTNRVWNPTKGCSRVSAGCINCYAERQAIRQVQGAYRGLIKSHEHGPRWTGAVRLDLDALELPFRWRKPKLIFVNSMSDLFHESLSRDQINCVYAAMALAPHHTFQVLTKRASRMQAYIRELQTAEGTNAVANKMLELARRWHIAEPGDRDAEVTARQVTRVRWNTFERAFDHVWHGVSCEDQITADERIPLLLDTPSALRFVSAEPLLGPIDFRQCTGIGWCVCQVGDPFVHKHYSEPPNSCARCGCNAYVGLDWVIVGGESGPRARECDVAWIRSIVEQCKAADVACFVKQMGSAWARAATREARIAAISIAPTADPKGGDQNEWPEDLRVREFPLLQVPS